MKFSQLIEDTLEIFFLKNHMQNVMEKLFPDLFLTHKNVAYLYHVRFYCMSS